MSLTIVLSGPKAAEQQARTALAAAGFTVQATDHNHGLPDDARGRKVRQAVSFITVEGDDIDGAAAAVASLKYRLRMHHETVKQPPPPIAEQLLKQLAELRADVDRLLAAGGES